MSEPGTIRGIAVLAGLVAGVAAGGAADLAACRGAPFRFAVVDPGALCRSGQLGWRDLAIACDRHGIRTIVDLCPEKRDSRRAREEYAFARARGIRHVHIPVPGDLTGAGAHIARFLEVLDDPAARPVLVHCWQGLKRTAVMVAIYEREYRGLSAEAAVAGLPAFGKSIGDFSEAEKGCVRNYVPRREKR